MVLSLGWQGRILAVACNSALTTSSLGSQEVLTVYSLGGLIDNGSICVTMGELLIILGGDFPVWLL